MAKRIKGKDFYKEIMGIQKLRLTYWDLWIAMVIFGEFLGTCLNTDG